MAQPVPPPRPNRRPLIIAGVLLVAGVAVYVYIRQRNAANAANSAASSSTQAPPDNTYEEQSSATAEYGQLESQAQANGQSIAAAQAAETQTFGDLYGTDVTLGQTQTTVTNQGKQLASQAAQLKTEQAQIAALQKQLAASKKPVAKPKKVHAT